MPHELTIGQLSARSGVSQSALRFYERQGLIGARRTEGDIELPADELERLRCDFGHVRFRWRPRWEAQRPAFRRGV